MLYKYNRDWRNIQGKLDQIVERAKRDKRLKFTSLVHLINAENLAECYKELKRNKACGIDQVTVEAYGENLEEKLRTLVDSMKKKAVSTATGEKGIYTKNWEQRETRARNTINRR